MEYYIIIAASLIIILSYIFNRLSLRTNIPSVLMLIILGVLSREFIGLIGMSKTSVLRVFQDISLLEVLGTLGLILIVLEAALELKIEKSKYGLITRSFLAAISGLLLSMFIIAGIFYFSFEEMSWLNSLIHATPLSIISSAIVIPSVVSLDEHQEEFHIYESTFSDILGIMIFYLLIGIAESENQVLAIGDFTMGLFITIVISILLSYALIYIFQKLETRIKLFLMISVLFLLFSVGKLMHLSSLLVILIFGIILNNNKLFFSGPLRKYVRPLALENIREAFLMITIESAFVIRTFFFVIFGFTIVLSAIMDVQVALISLFTLVAIYGARFISLYLFDRKYISDTISIAPRGLITLLLSYSIPLELRSDEFSSGILLFVIIISSLVMTYGLIKNGGKKEEELAEVE